MDARPINAVVTVGELIPTGNPGEYTFENAVYNNQADLSGNAAYDVEVGWVLFGPTASFFSGAQIAGSVHRYKLTALEVVDPNTISGTILWDEAGSEQFEVPMPGSWGISQRSANYSYGFPPSDAVYPELGNGFTTAAIQTDLWNITDQIESGGEGPGPSPSNTYKTTIGNAIALSFTITHSLGTLDVDIKVFDLNTGGDVYPGIVRTGPNTVRLDFTYPIEASSHRVIVRG